MFARLIFAVWPSGQLIENFLRVQFSLSKQLVKIFLTAKISQSMVRVLTKVLHHMRVEDKNGFTCTLPST